MTTRAKLSLIIIIIIVGCLCALAALSVTVTAEKPRHEARYSTQFVPILGGVAMGVAITDHDEQKTYLYKVPQKNGDLELLTTFGLATAGKDRLKVAYHESEK